MVQFTQTISALCRVRNIVGEAKNRGSREQRVAKAIDRADVFHPHSVEYRRMLETAVSEAERLGLTPLPRVDPYRKVSDDVVERVRALCNDEYLPRLTRMVPGYWGSSCQNLAMHLFAWLRIAGYDVDLVVGEVNIQGNLEYDATLEDIRNEYRIRLTEGSQRLHMWLTLGDDVIVDPGLAHRLIKYYRVPESVLDPILVHRADEFGTRLAVHHWPMLVGADFATKTNRVGPFDLLDIYMNGL